VVDFVAGADEIERMFAGGLAGRFVLHIDGKTVGELGAIVRQNGVNAMREVGQEPIEEADRGLSIALLKDFDIDVAGGAVDRNEGVAFAPLQGRQMLQVEVNEAHSCLFKYADARLIRLFALTDPVALETAVNGAAGQLSVDAASHHLDDIVQWQL
jgi:hypothetical protein